MLLAAMDKDFLEVAGDQPGPAEGDFIMKTWGFQG